VEYPFEREESARTYSIVRHHRDLDGEWEKVVESGIIGYKSASAKSEALNETERKLHPTKTSWSRDLFIPRLEKL
jgi:hypothetical protein